MPTCFQLLAQILLSETPAVLSLQLEALLLITQGSCSGSYDLAWFCITQGSCSGHGAVQTWHCLPLLLSRLVHDGRHSLAALHLHVTHASLRWNLKLVGHLQNMRPEEQAPSHALHSLAQFKGKGGATLHVLWPWTLPASCEFPSS